MEIISWINNNGVTAMFIWAFFLIVAGTVPPLTDEAGFFAKWAYAILKGISLNARGISNALQGAGINMKFPEMKLEGKKEEKSEL